GGQCRGHCADRGAANAAETKLTRQFDNRPWIDHTAGHAAGQHQVAEAIERRVFIHRPRRLHHVIARWHDFRIRARLRPNRVHGSRLRAQGHSARSRAGCGSLAAAPIFRGSHRAEKAAQVRVVVCARCSCVVICVQVHR
ncbi:MAG: hypothetical protein ACK559_16025, partial [bacterium]